MIKYLRIFLHIMGQQQQQQQLQLFTTLIFQIYKFSFIRRTALQQGVKEFFTLLYSHRTFDLIYVPLMNQIKRIARTRRWNSFINVVLLAVLISMEDKKMKINERKLSCWWWCDMRAVSLVKLYLRHVVELPSSQRYLSDFLIMLIKYANHFNMKHKSPDKHQQQPFFLVTWLAFISKMTFFHHHPSCTQMWSLSLSYCVKMPLFIWLIKANKFIS